MNNINTLYLIFLGVVIFSCQSNPNVTVTEASDKAQSISKSYKTTGEIKRIDDRIEALIPAESEIEILAEGFDWAEGPLWIEAHQMLLFSDIPPNKVMKWTEAEGVSTYLHPSGFTGEQSESNEPGSNGLILDQSGKLLLCQHGDRRIAAMDAPLDQPEAKYISVIEKWNGKRFNSPNDLVMDKNGNLFFTDPPYGLAQQMKDPSKEIDFQGVYFWSKKTGEVKLLTDEMSRPNGIALSPDESTLYVANSDPNQVIWMAFDNDQGTISNGRIFFNANELAKTSKGLPDGLKVDPKGNVWATGPGGVLIFSPEGEHLGTIKTGQATANCAFNEDYSEFFMTADMLLLRLKL